VLQLFQRRNRRRIRNADVERQPPPEDDLPIEHADGIGSAYADLGEYPLRLLFDGGFDARVDGGCFRDGGSLPYFGQCTPNVLHDNMVPERGRKLALTRELIRAQFIFEGMDDRPLARLDLERAIALRWAMRDIIADRLKLTPVRDEDLRALVEMGFVELRDDAPVVTQAGIAALE